MYDLIIIGGGPAGVAAGVYAARKKIKTLLIADNFGGQSLVSADVQNWIGTKSISGFDLAKNLEEHLRAQEGIEIIENDLVTGVDLPVRDTQTGKTAQGFNVKTQNGKTFETKYILITSGSKRKKLGVPGEKEFEGKGVVYCTTCDAPLFGGKTVAVVGGGNSALEGVEDLIPYASKIYLLVRTETLRGDPVTQEKVKNHPQVEILWNTVIEEIKGKDFVSGVRIKNVSSGGSASGGKTGLPAQAGETRELPLDGVFVEIGIMPNSDFVKDIVQLNALGEIVVDHKTQASSVPGIWAAGDASDVFYKQNNISAGDAVKAVLNIYDKLKKQ